jgi:hypothetical protein
LDSEGEEDLSLSMSVPNKQSQNTALGKVSRGPQTAQAGWYQGGGNINSNANSGNKPTGKAVKIPQLADYLEL